MISLKNFFYGTALLDDEVLEDEYITRNITFGPVSDVNKTILFYTDSVDYDIGFIRKAISLRLVDASTLQATWWRVYNLTTYHSINWWVLEFNEGVSVQHYYSYTKPTPPITITGVNPASSFIIPSWAVYVDWEIQGSSEWSYTGATFRFLDSTSVDLGNDSTKIADVSMQVVQWDGAYAQHTMTTIDSTTNKDMTINSVNTERTVLFSTNNWTSSADNPTSVDQYARCFLNTDTAIRVSVDTTGYPQDIAASAVVIPQFMVQRGMTTMEDVTTSTTINLVDLNNAVAWVSMPNRPYAQRNEPTESIIYPGAHSVALAFSDATRLDMFRGRPWSEIDIDWQVLEFQPPSPRHSFTMYQDPAIF